MANDKSINSLVHCLHVHEQVWKFYGIFDIESDSVWMKRLMTIYGICYRVFFVYMGCIMQSMALMNSTSIKETFQIIFINVAYMNAAINTLIMSVKRREVQELWAKLDDVEYRVRVDEEREFIHESRFHIRRIINYYSWFGALNMVTLLFIPLMFNEHRLPFYQWYPYDPNNSYSTFYFTFAFQFFCATFAGGSNVATNMYMYSVLVRLNFNVQLFNSRIKRLGYDNGMGMDWIKVPREKASFYRETIEFITFHLKIDRLCKDIHKLFNGLLYAQVIQSAFVFANSAFLLIAVELTPGEFAVPAFWLCAFLAEMSIYCYFGTNIIHTFSYVSQSIYFSNFIAFDKKTINAMLLLMNVTGARQMSITAVGLIKFELSLETLVKILKTTYSIVMVIRTM